MVRDARCGTVLTSEPLVDDDDDNDDGDDADDDGADDDDTDNDDDAVGLASKVCYAAPPSETVCSVAQCDWRVSPKTKSCLLRMKMCAGVGMLECKIVIM